MTDINLSFEDIRKMRKGTNSYEVFPFPFMEEVSVGVRVLTQDEVLKAINTGREKAKRELKEATPDEEASYGRKELMYKAVVKVTESTEDKSEPFFSSPEAL